VLVDTGEQRIFTKQNPNWMIQAGRISLIDNGAALTFQYDWANLTEQTPRQPGMFLENHLLRVSPRELADSDATLAPRLTRRVLERALADVPDEFPGPATAGGRRPFAPARCLRCLLVEALEKSPPIRQSGIETGISLGILRIVRD
jgi:hypothetical protein